MFLCKIEYMQNKAIIHNLINTMEELTYMNERDGKERLFRATIELLAQEPDVEKVTVQQIAERAGVAVGTICYHFGSKNSLIISVLKQQALCVLNKFDQHAVENFPDPIKRIQALLKLLFNLDPTKEKTAQFMLTVGVLQDNMQIPLYLVSILKEILGEGQDELELRILALQLLEPLYSASCNPVPFRFYSGVDIYNKKEREHFIDLLVNNSLKMI